MVGDCCRLIFSEESPFQLFGTHENVIIWKKKGNSEKKPPEKHPIMNHMSHYKMHKLKEKDSPLWFFIYKYNAIPNNNNFKKKTCLLLRFSVEELQENQKMFKQHKICRKTFDRKVTFRWLSEDPWP